MVGHVPRLAEIGASASTAAYQVGYASASQFSREFKRLFDLPPSEVGKLV